MGELVINRVWAMPHKWTFKVPEMRGLVRKYALDGRGWADPFAGRSRLVEFRNDLNPKNEQPSCKDAADFMCEFGEESLSGVIFDPPYSVAQVSRSYEDMGLDFKGAENPTGGFPKVRDAIARAVKRAGHVISFGWNTTGMGERRGFDMVEILIVAHGGNRNDTLCTVERRRESML